MPGVMAQTSPHKAVVSDERARARRGVTRWIVAESAATTAWRLLRAHAIRPWNFRSWIFPRDPKSAEKAGGVLEVYEGRWEGQLLEPGDFVVDADEKPPIQAR